MIQTVYPEAYQNQISIFDFNMRPGPSSFARPDCTNKDESQCPRGVNPGRTYRFHVDKPVVPFGYGLSYTRFTYSIVEAPSTVSLKPLQELLERTEANGFIFAKTKHADEAAEQASWKMQVQYAVNVTNTGHMNADDVVLGFMIPPGAGKNGVPLKYLFGFERVHVKAGETKTVYLYPALTDFALANRDGTLSATAGKYEVHFGLSETHAAGMGFVQSQSLTARLAELVV
jgi:pre-mRNA-splicing factor SYF2/beta-D-xylosidase 4